MRQQELQDEEERMHKRLEVSSSNVNVAVADVEYSSNAVAESSTSAIEHDEIVSSQDSCATPMVRPPPATRANRYDSVHFVSLPIPQHFPIMSLSVSASIVFVPTYGYLIVCEYI